MDDFSPEFASEASRNVGMNRIEYKAVQYLAAWGLVKITAPKRTNGQPVRETVYAGFPTKIDAQRLGDVLSAAEAFRIR